MNRQRGFIPIGLIAYGVAGIAVMALVGTAVYKARHWCNVACTEQMERADKAEASIKAAQERATAIALLWAGKVTEGENNARQGDLDRTARFAPLVADASRLPSADARARFPTSGVRVLDAAIAAGNAEIARPAGKPAADTAAAPAAPARTVDAVDVAGVTRWGVDVAALYASCAAQVGGWQGFYGDLQRAQGPSP